MADTGQARARAQALLVVVGTRPEAIKLAPIVLALDDDPRFRRILVTTGQHTDLVIEALDAFGLRPDLHCHAGAQEHTSIGQRASRCLADLTAVVAAHRPACVIVQGDTATTVAGALAGFYAGVPVVHVEAGLRTGDLCAPWPEEGNRRLVSAVATLHLAPTKRSADNLLAEGIAATSVEITGNTVVDALLHIVEDRTPYSDPALASVDADRGRIVLFTAHRRESWGEPLRQIATGVRQVADEHPDLTVIAALHPNPTVRDTVLPVLADHQQVIICDPAAYGPFVRLMARSSLIITDSGGIQEEAPSLGVPVLVTRDVTERSEALAPGRVELVGTDPLRIAGAARRLLADRHPVSADNPYGDGHAAGRSLTAIAAMLDLAEPSATRSVELAGAS